MELNTFYNLHYPFLKSWIHSWIHYTFLKSSIPFWHLPYFISKFPFLFPFHFIPCPALVVDSILLLLLLHFPPTVVDWKSCWKCRLKMFQSLKIRKRRILKKLLLLPALFLILSLPSSLPISFIKVLPLSPKIYCFQLPLLLPHPCLLCYSMPYYTLLYDSVFFFINCTIVLTRTL